jgi:2-oxoglutarate ferredoxin oxidoreductase subunit beta
MTGGQVAPTTPVGALATTSPYGCYERPFNLPFLAESCGAVYVARWTAFHVRHITRSMVKAFTKKGFAFIEIIAPCPTLYQRRNRLGGGLEAMRFYKQKSVIKNGASTKDLELGFQSEIVVGEFVNIERPTLTEVMDSQRQRIAGPAPPSLEEKRTDGIH